MAEPWENNQKDPASTHSEGWSAGDGNPSPTEKIKNLLAQLRRGRQATDNVVVWTPEEQRIVEEGKLKFVSLPSVTKYAKIASQLSNKTMYDVAFRCRWMDLKKTGKRRREEDDRPTKKLGDKKKRLSDSTPLKHVADMADCDGIFDEVIHSEEGELFLTTSLTLRQISENLASLQVHENLDLIVKARDNIRKTMNNLREKDGLMKDAPPLGVDIDEEKVNALLSFPFPKDLPLATAIIDKAAEIQRRKTVALHQISGNLEGSQFVLSTEIKENLKMFASAGDNILNVRNNMTDEDRLVKEALPINVEKTEELLNSMLPHPPPPNEPPLHAFF